MRITWKRKTNAINRLILKHLRTILLQDGMTCKLTTASQALSIYKSKYSRLIDYTIWCFSNRIEFRINSDCLIKSIELCDPDAFDKIIKAVHAQREKERKDAELHQLIREQNRARQLALPIN